MTLLTTNCQHLLEHIKSKRIPEKKSPSVSLTMLKPLTVWITANCGKFLKRCECQTTLPASWETCMQVRKQQWAVDMGKWTGSKLRKEPVKAGCILSSCLFNLYTECVQVCMFSWFNCVQLFATLWNAAHQATLSMGFCRQEYWSGLPSLPPGDLPDPRYQTHFCLCLLHCRQILYPLSHLGSPK